MGHGNPDLNISEDAITRRDYRCLAIWAAGILLLYATVGYFGVRTLLDYRAETNKLRQSIIASALIDDRYPVREQGGSAEGRPVDVYTGIYVNRIGEFSLKEAGWTADFDIWFRWKDGSVNPGENFHVVNGQIDVREKREEYLKDGERYARYRVKARITKFFDSSRFPFGEGILTIQVEDASHDKRAVRFVTDERESGLSRFGIQQNLQITKTLALVKQHRYASWRGDPSIPAGSSDVHPMFIYAMFVSTQYWKEFMSMFQALFISVAISLIVFFIKPIHVDPRFGLGVGAVFAAVGNNIYLMSLLPQTDRMSLTNVVNAVGLLTIFLTLVQSTISLHLYDSLGRERLSLVFDRISFAVLAAAYGAVNMLLPFAAM